MSGGKHSCLSVGTEGGDRANMTEAQAALNYYIEPGVGAQRSVQAYTDTSDKYDQFVGAFDYSAPRKVADTLAELYSKQAQRETVQILDVAAGTGLVGIEMHKLGFRNMDALDPSQGMLNVASRRGIYGRLFTEYIDHKQLPINQDSYDAIVIAGGMGENQIPCSALHEMIRLVKPGGYIVNVTRVEHLTHCSDYIGRLEQLMERLQTEGRWRQVTRSTFSNFLRGKEGLLLVHQIL